MANDRTGARAAVMAFFAPPAVANLNTIHKAWPRLNPWADYTAGQPAGTQSGAVGVVHLARDDERRLSTGLAGTGAKKRIDYEVELQVILRSTKLSPDDAVDDYDAVIDGIKARLRSNQTLASPDVWQAGEGDTWGEHADPSITPEGAIEVSGAVHFQITQQINI